MNTNVNLLKPGTLVIPEMGFWLNVNPIAWRLEIENPSAKMKGFIEGGDKMLLGVLLNEAHNGLVLTDKIEKNPISLEAPFVKTDWEYVDQLDDQRITVLLFGERKAIFSVTEQLLESKNLSITNQGWKIVSTPTY